MEFDRDLFAYHTMPFAAYAEPEGFASLTTIKAPQRKHYEQHVPLTCAATRALFASVTQRDEWGEQYVVRFSDGNEGGQWRTETAAHTYPTRDKHQRRGKALSERRVLRSLSRTGMEDARGRSGMYALARTDKHLKEMEFGLWGNEEFRTTPVNALLIDIDMDIAWSRKDISSVRRELAIEREIAIALQLPFRVFRTGGRGHQIVLPLPVPVDRSVAAWLMDAYIDLLLPYHFQSGGAAKADCHNLTGLVRLAGGRHATTERVAFWIDPTDASLFPIAEQIEMMRTGYRHPLVPRLEAEAFACAAAEIAQILEKNFYIGAHEFPSNTLIRELAFAAVSVHLPDNLLVERYHAAQEQLALPDEKTLWGNLDVEGSMASLEAALTIAEKRDARENQADGRTVDADEGTRAWAEKVWALDWPASGTFWSWISEAGRRGITAAKILFGEENAEKALLARVDAHPIAQTMVSKARERKRVIRALYSKHKMTGFGAARRLADLELPDAAAALVSTIVEKLHAAKPIQPRNRPDIEHLTTILLLAFYADANTDRRGYIDLSLDDLVSSIRQGWPSDTINRDRIRRCLKRFLGGEAECGFALIERIENGQSWTQASRYRAGTDLYGTFWGQSLPTFVDETKNSLPRTKPLTLRVRNGGVYTFEPPKKRGRKPKSFHENGKID